MSTVHTAMSAQFEKAGCRHGVTEALCNFASVLASAPCSTRLAISCFSELQVSGSYCTGQG